MAKAVKSKTTKAKAPPRTNVAAAKVGFIESMECLGVTKLPEGPGWTYEIKLDGFRLEVVNDANATLLYSRRGNVLNEKFPYIAGALKKLPKNTILDGEIVAIDENKRSDFNLLQNFRSAAAHIQFYAFDILMLKGKSLLARPLSDRREILADVLTLNEHVGLSIVDTRPASHMLKFVTAHSLEGVVAKRADSIYEPGRRSGLWSKHRVNQGQEFVIGGYTPGNHGFDALIIGVYKGEDLMFSARVRAGFVPATRRDVFAKIRHLKTDKCPFSNLPEKTAGRWGQGLTADKMKECFWLKPEAVARIDFAEWTGGDKLRHTKFVAMRDEKDPRKVVKEAN